MNNPLLEQTRPGVSRYVPFDVATPENFKEVFSILLPQAEQALDDIIECTDAPTYENTVEALEYYDEHLEYVAKIFFNLQSSYTNPEIESLAEVIEPQLATLRQKALFSEKLFTRIKQVYDQNLPLRAEAKRLLDRTYEGYIRNGALLSEVDKKRIKDIEVALIELTQKYNKNILEATKAYELIITSKQDLAGIPERICALAKNEAEKRGKPDVWVFTLSAESCTGFLEYADNEALRKEIFVASGLRATFGDTDNSNIAVDILRLRKERAFILGHESHADYVLQDRMAKTPITVNDFLQTLYTTVYSKAKDELALLRSYKELKTGSGEIYPWDIAYFSTKMLREQFDFDEEVFRPYFSIDRVVEGVYIHAQKLYGLTAKKRVDVPVYDEYVSVYDIYYSNGELAGVIYIDPFPRSNKRQGGWIDDIRSQSIRQGVRVVPQLLIVCNFTPPAPGAPALLSFDDVKTLFHEFGHGLHVLLSQCTYSSLSGFNTSLDFVELPSQFMDKWVTEKESLELFAQHYQTGVSIPASYIDTVKKVEHFMPALSLFAQLRHSVLDMKVHSKLADTITNIEVFETEVLASYQLLPKIIGTKISTNFKHIFSSGYDAGYYSYLWSELLAADAFEYFKTNGLFSEKLAADFREHILAKGNTEDPEVLYRRFRGQEPDPGALLRSRGIV